VLKLTLGGGKMYKKFILTIIIILTISLLVSACKIGKIEGSNKSCSSYASNSVSSSNTNSSSSKDSSYSAQIEGVFVLQGNAITGLTEFGRTLEYIVIPKRINGVTIKTISSKSLWYSTNIKVLEIQADLTDMGYNAFSGCSSLTTINITGNVKKIGDYAFKDCINLKYVNLGTALTKIGTYAFYNCYRLESIVIPSMVTYIGEFAFISCASLKSVRFSDPNGWARYYSSYVGSIGNLESDTLAAQIITGIAGTYIWKKV